MRKRPETFFKHVASIVLLAASAIASAQSPWPLVPPTFDVPRTLDTPEFRLRVLTVNDVVKDYEAVVTSADHLKTKVFPGSTWPDGLTIESNLVDLGWHQKEFENRTSFTYTVVDPQDTRVLGCVYIYASRRSGYDAVVYLWARQSELPGGLEDRLLVAVKAWLAKEWPFKQVAFPGRDIPWDAWRKIPVEKR